jgi:hypothetical protein
MGNGLHTWWKSGASSVSVTDQVADSILGSWQPTMGFGFADFDAAVFDSHSVVDQIHTGRTYSPRLVHQLVAALDKVAPQCKEHG